MARQPPVGAALGGGGARGAAHIGVLQAFEGNGVTLAAIAGTSAGAVIGAMYAATLDAGWVRERYLSYLKSETFRSLGTHHILREQDGKDSFLNQVGRFVKDRMVISLAARRHGIIDRQKLVNAIRFLLPAGSFDELKIPLYVTSTDLNSGEEIIADRGDLVEAVVRSSSIPGFVKPLETGDQIVVDGGVSSPVPVRALQKGEVEITVAVDVARREVKPLGDFSLIELMSRVDQVRGVRLADELSRRADLAIRPKVGSAHWSEFGRSDQFISAGREAAENALPKLDRLIRQRSGVWWHFRKTFL